MGTDRENATVCVRHPHEAVVKACWENRHSERLNVGAVTEKLSISGEEGRN